MAFVIVVAVTAFLWRLAYGKKREARPEDRLADLRAQLVWMNMGRTDVAERLVAYEHERRPELTETGAYRAAIGRMRR